MTWFKVTCGRATRYIKSNYFDSKWTESIRATVDGVSKPIETKLESGSKVVTMIMNNNLTYS